MPLANLMEFQQRPLDPSTSAAALKQVSPPLLAAKLGTSLYTPPLNPADPEVRVLTSLFTDVLPAEIQYLNERKQFENEFLQALSRSSIPATVAWGIHDMAAPLRVADYSWKPLSSRARRRLISGRCRAAITTSSTINPANSRASFAWSLRANRRPRPRLFPQIVVPRCWSHTRTWRVNHE
jgi:hypothetical protein